MFALGSLFGGCTSPAGTSQESDDSATEEMETTVPLSMENTIPDYSVAKVVTDMLEVHVFRALPVLDSPVCRLLEVVHLPSSDPRFIFKAGRYRGDYTWIDYTAPTQEFEDFMDEWKTGHSGKTFPAPLLVTLTLTQETVSILPRIRERMAHIHAHHPHVGVWLVLLLCGDEFYDGPLRPIAEIGLCRAYLPLPTPAEMTCLLERWLITAALGTMAIRRGAIGPKELVDELGPMGASLGAWNGLTNVLLRPLDVISLSIERRPLATKYASNTCEERLEVIKKMFEWREHIDVAIQGYGWKRAEEWLRAALVNATSNKDDQYSSFATRTTFRGQKRSRMIGERLPEVEYRCYTRHFQAKQDDATFVAPLPGRPAAPNNFASAYEDPKDGWRPSPPSSYSEEEEVEDPDSLPESLPDATSIPWPPPTRKRQGLHRTVSSRDLKKVVPWPPVGPSVGPSPNLFVGPSEPVATPMETVDGGNSADTH